jgi:outer membrane lipoprotein-sorting protein
MRIRLSAAVSLGACVVVLGEELPSTQADALERRFFAAQSGINTLEADFIQTITAPGLGRPAKSKGQVFFRSPELLRIQYSDPAGEWMQLDEQNFTIVRSNRQPETRPSDHPSARVLVALREILRGKKPAENMNRRVYVEGNIYRVILVPEQEAANQPSRIEIEADVEGFKLRSMVVSLPRGATMRFDFSSVRRNHRLPANVFTVP